MEGGINVVGFSHAFIVKCGDLRLVSYTVKKYNYTLSVEFLMILNPCRKGGWVRTVVFFSRAQ